MGKPQKKKPTSTLDTAKTIIEMLAGIANIVLVIYTILKGLKRTGRETSPNSSNIGYTICKGMCKRKFNAPLYLLFAANCIYAVSQRAFNWLFYVSAALTAVVLAFDLWEAVKYGRKK